jgi:hypothetical protein
MRSLVRGIVGFVVGDDVWIAVAVAVLLLVADAVVDLGGEAWWLLPIGVPTAVWISLVRARRRVQGTMTKTPL